LIKAGQRQIIGSEAGSLLRSYGTVGWRKKYAG
jgi:hypothetical protein